MISNPVDVATIRDAAQAPLPEGMTHRLKSRPHIVWCGRMIEVKNPILAIDTLAKLRGRFGLTMIGDGPLLPAVKEHVASLSLGDDVIFTGALANPYPYMAAAELGLLTSHREGFPNVVNEMLACGVQRVVVTDCAGDLDRNRRVRITAHDADALAQALGAEAEVSRNHDRPDVLQTPEAFLEAMFAGARIVPEGRLA